MKSWIPTLIALLITSLSYSQIGPTLSIQQQKEDFQIMKGSLEDFHPGLYWYRSRAEMNDIFNETLRSFNAPISRKQYFRKLAALSAKIGCGHTQIGLPDEPSDQEDRYIPIYMMHENGKVFCTQNNSLDPLSIQPGDEIIKINGIAADSLYNYILEVMWSDGFNTTLKRRIFNEHFPTAYGYFINQPDQYTIEFTDQNNPSVQKISVQALSLSQIKKNSSSRYPTPKKDPAHLQLHYVENQSTAILRITSFSNWKENGKSFVINKQMQKAFEKLNESKPENLIIDLRDNGGGKEPWRLLAYLVDEEFQFATEAEARYSKKSDYSKYQKLSWPMRWLNYRGFYNLFPGASKTKKLNDSIYLLTKHTMVLPFKPLKPRYKGEVYVLIDGGSFSATSLLAANIKSRNLATFIGEETGGSYYGNTAMSPTTVTLPNSKITLDIPLVRFKLNVDPIFPLGSGTKPDYEIIPTLYEVISGQDVQMAFTLKLIEQKEPSSKVKLN